MTKPIIPDNTDRHRARTALVLVIKIYGPGSDLATFASLKVFQNFLEARSTIPSFFHHTQNESKTSRREPSDADSNFAIYFKRI